MTHHVSDRLSKKASRHVKERIIEFLLFGAAAFSVFVTVAIVYVLVKESWVFFETVPLSDFLFDTQWTPLFDDAHYGIMVLLSGTLTSSGVALLVAIPLGTIIAIYLSEFAGFKLPLYITEITFPSAGDDGDALQAEVIRDHYRLWFCAPMMAGMPSRGISPI